jgi:G3E family GTPase
LRARLHALNPRAEFAAAVQGEIDPAFFLDIGLRTARADGVQLERWLGAAGSSEGEAYLGKRLSTGAHDRAIRSFVLWFDRPFSWQTFSSAMELLTSMRGPDLLRVKGLVNVAGERGPVVVQGVQHIFHPPTTLDAWPSEDRRSRLVFITRNIPQEAVAALFAAVGGLDK